MKEKEKEMGREKAEMLEDLEGKMRKIRGK